jgi:hypothetical protein
MTRFLRLHSGAVVRNGVAVLLVGASGAGKSTLVTQLVIDGFSLLSDDEVWIDPGTHFAHPTTRPLLLKESAWDFFPDTRSRFVPAGEEDCRSWWLSPDDLRPGCRGVASPIWGLVIVTPPSGRRPALQEIGQTEALTKVLAESMNFPDVSDVALPALVEIIRSARLFRLTNGDLHVCASLLSETLP